MFLFSKTRKDFGGPSREQRIGDAAKESFNSIRFSTEAAQILSQAFLTTESLSAQQQSELTEAVSGIPEATTTLAEDLRQDENIELTPAEVANIQESMIIASNPEAYLKSAAERPEGVVVPVIGGEPEVSPVNLDLSKESFEVHGMMNTLAMTVSYNVKAEKQSKAAELFFPTISLDSTQNNYTIDVALSTVFTSKEYDLTGNGDVWRNQKHIIKALRNASILKSNFTDIVPVFRQGQNDDKFVDTNILPVRQVVSDYGETFTTSLLKVNEEIRIIALAQTDRMIGLGMQDDTDQISGNPRLKTLGLKVGNDTVLFENLQFHQQAQFTYAPNGDREGIQLIYNVNTHLVDENTKGVKSGQLPTELQALKDKKLEALLQFNVTGTGNTDLGTVSLNAANVKVKAIRKADTKELVDMTTGDGAALVTALQKCSIVGYEIDATRTNSNIREHGLVLEDRVQRIIYGVRLHSPISSRRPFDEKTEITDAQRVDSLIKTTFARRTNAAITALYDILTMLKGMPKQLETAEPFAYSSVGVGQYFAKSYVRDVSLDVLATVQSLQSSDRLNNVSSVLTNFLLAEATKAYTASELAAAYELTDMGGSGFRPHVIAIADVFTSKFIFREGDVRTLGNGFDFTLEECSDDRLVDGGKDGSVGTIFMSFGVPRSGSLSVPLWFGNCLDKREIPRILDRARGSKYQHEVMVQPWFSHICHLPVLVRIGVLNLSEAVQKRVPFHVENKVVTP